MRKNNRDDEIDLNESYGSHWNPIDDCDLVINYRCEKAWIHAHYDIYKDGVLIGHSYSEHPNLNAGSLPYQDGQFKRYILSADKKKSRADSWVKENVPSIDRIYGWQKRVFVKLTDLGSNNLGIKLSGSYGYLTYSCRIKSVKCLPLRVCPMCARIWKEEETTIDSVCFKYKRCINCKEIKRHKRHQSYFYFRALGMKCPVPIFGSQIKRSKGESDPRDFLYRDKNQGISKGKLIRCITKHLKKTVSIKPIKKNTVDFFKMIIGVREITKITKQLAA